jgi:drug/metabolite transporter (DMT)-like permease
VSKLLYALIACFLANLVAFVQLQGHYVWPDVKYFKEQWFIIMLSAFIAPALWYSTKWSFEHFGFFWNFRLIGFGVGTIVFGILAWLFLDEIPTMKTIISLILALCIILIQLTNLEQIR